MSTRDAILGGRSPRRPQPSSREHGERGAVAVEAALFLSVVLVPLLLGIITYGNYFWQAQRVQPLSARLPLESIVGEFNCAQLVDRIKTTVQNAMPEVTGLIDGQLPLDAIGVHIDDVLATVGVDVTVTIAVEASLNLGGMIPLPHGGNLLTEASYRLDNVKLTTASC